MTRTACRMFGALTLSFLALSGCTMVHAQAMEASHPASGSAPVPAKQVAMTRLVSWHLPPDARVVTISQRPWLNSDRKQPAPVTVTNRSEVARILALVAALPPSSGGTYSCPADFGGSIALTFRGAVGRPALAVVTAGLSGCASVDASIGRQQIGLGPLEGGRTLAGEVLHVVGLHWTLNPPQVHG